MTRTEPTIAAPTDTELARALAAPGGIARLAERLDAVGADVVVVGIDRFRPDPDEEPRVDPTVVALELGRAAPRLGVLVAVAPTRDHPYNTARRILSIDHLLRGRAGVLLGGADLGTVRSAHGTVWTDAAEDDALAAEYARVLRGLWTSWPLESIVTDREHGVFANTSDIRALDHDGSWRIGGALTTPTSRQGEPVIAVLDGNGHVPDADLVLDPATLRTSARSATQTAAEPTAAGRASGTDPAAHGADATLRDVFGIGPRSLDRRDARPALAGAGA